MQAICDKLVVLTGKKGQPSDCSFRLFITESDKNCVLTGHSWIYGGK